jgi:dihydroxyacetone kinase-like predicted kinase
VWVWWGARAPPGGPPAPPPLEHHAPARISHPDHSSQTYRFCTNFAVTGSELTTAGHITALEELGDSVLVVGDAHTLKIHVHTDEPERATAVFDRVGEVSHLDVSDMHAQVAQRLATLSAAFEQRCGVLAVVSGPGVGELFMSLGAAVLDGGPTLNPSTYELLAGIHEVAAEQVVVLPNSPNVIMAAERAAELSDKQVLVVASRSQQAGLAAAVALEPSHTAAENAAALSEALDRVRTGWVAQAARDDPDGRYRIGEAVGSVDDELVAWGDPVRTLGTVVELLADGAELLTCIEGDGAPAGRDEAAALVPDGVEFEHNVGGQPSYWWLLASE